MTVISNPLLLKKKAAAGGSSDYQIERSLRFNRPDTPYLEQNCKEGNRRQWTWSGWIKKSDVTNSQTLFSGKVGTGTQIAGSLEVRILSGAQLYIAFCESNGTPLQWSAEGKAYYRDPAAWQHWVLVLDTPNSDANERFRVYVNGKKVEDWGTRNTITQNFEYGINKSGASNVIGAHYSGGNVTEHFGGYFSDVQFIDGLCLSPCAFAQYSSLNVWEPKTLAIPAPNDGTTWSSRLYTSDSTYNGSATNTNFNSSPNAATAAFDGNAATYAQNNEGSPYANWTYFRPATGFTGVSTLRVWTQYVSNIRINGVQSSASPGQNGHNSGAWYEIPASEIPDTLTEIAIQGSSHSGNASSGRFGSVEINGVLLVDDQIDTKDFSNPHNGIEWSESRTGDNSWNNSDTTPDKMFDGSMASTAGNPVEAANDKNFTFTFGGGISNVETIDINLKITGSIGTNADCKVNGTSIFNAAKTAVGDNVAGWYRVPAATHGGTLTSLYGGRDSGAGNVKFYAMKVNGIELVDAKHDNSYHLKFNDISTNKRLGRTYLGNVSVGDATGGLPIYNTTADTDGYDDGSVKGSGNRTDSLNSSLILAMPLSDSGNTDSTTWKDISADIKGSGSNKAVTRTGSSTQYSTVHSRLYGASTVFDNASSQNLNIPYSSDFDFTSDQDFCIEGWFLATEIVNSGHLFSLGTSSEFQCNINIIEHTGYPGKCFNFESPGTRVRSDAPIAANVWYHFACVSDGGTLKMYLNGKLQTITGDNTVGTSDTVMLGRGTHYNVNTGWKGHIQDFRIYRNKKYSANFIPPTRGDLTVTNIAQSSGVRTVADADAKTKPFYQTTGEQGGTKVSPTAYNTDSSAGTTDGTGLVFALPGDVLTDEHNHVNTGSSAKTVGTAGSIATSTSDSRFYGTSLDFGAYNAAKNVHVTKANAGSDFNFGTGDFTVEVWFKQTDQTLNSGSPATIFDFDADEGYGGGWMWLAVNADNLVFYYSENASSLAYQTVMAKGDLLNKWTHFACSHDTSANKLYTFINGELKNEISYATDWTGDRGVYLGQMNLSSDANRTFAGYMNDFRVYKGVAKYTSAFNPPAFGDVAGNDSVTDSPSSYGTDEGVGAEVRGNYATWNPLIAAGTTFSQGNLRMSWSGEGTRRWNTSTIAVKPGDGRFLVEHTLDGTMADEFNCGFMKVPNLGFYTAGDGAAHSYWWRKTGEWYNGSSVDNSKTVSAWANGDVLGVAIDYSGSTGSIYLYKNGTAQNSGNAVKTGLTDELCFLFTGYDTVAVDSNFGQRAYKHPVTISGNKFGALCTQNLPDLFSGEDAGTVNNPSKYFDTLTYTGNEGTQSIKGLGFQADLMWLKNRDSATDHQIYDAVRSTGSAGLKRLRTNLTNAEAEGDGSNTVNFLSDGFSLSGGGGDTNDAGKNYISWNWDAGTSAATASDSGDITPTAQWKNTTSGFSISQFSGSLSDVGVATVGHGLNAAPELVIIKEKGSSSRWAVMHTGLTNWSHILELNTTSGESNKSGNGTMNAPSATVFSTNYTDGINVSGRTHMAYCWAPIKGYSAFGKYSGNSSADGPFIYCGFKPRYFWVKKINNTDSNSGWHIYDTTRDTQNQSYKFIVAESAYYETRAANNTSDVTSYYFDFVSNGIKVRHDSNNLNNTGSTYIYAAFAEHPFKLARAR